MRSPSAAAWLVAGMVTHFLSLSAKAQNGNQHQQGSAQRAFQQGEQVIRDWGYYPAFSNVPEKYILFNETTLDVLDRIATPARRRSQRAVIFTTLRFGDAPTESVMGMISTFCYHLDRQGMLQHTMLITTDEATWQHLHDRGFPAFLDRSFPRRPEYVDAVEIRPETNNRVSWLQS